MSTKDCCVVECSCGKRHVEPDDDHQHTDTRSKAPSLHPIHNVVSDILVEIFYQCLPELPFKPALSIAPLLLCMVCSKWRKTVINTPRLWSRFTIRLRSWKKKLKVEVMHLWVERSRSSPLDIYMHDPSHTVVKPCPLPQIWETLLGHAHRWRTLHLSLDCRTASQVLEQLQTDQLCQELQYFYLERNRGESGSVSTINSFHMAKFPTLSTLVVEKICITSFLPPVQVNPYLRHLQLSINGKAQSKAILASLPLFPNLEILKCLWMLTANGFLDSEETRASDPASTTSGLKPITMNNLRTFTFTNVTGVVRYLASEPIFPVLTSLFISDRYCARLVLGILERSAPPIRHLRFGEAPYDSLSFRRCLELCPMLETLEGSRSLADFMAEKGLVIGERNYGASILCPELEEIRLEFLVHVPAGNSLKAIVETISTRFTRGSLRAFHFYYNDPMRIVADAVRRHKGVQPLLEQGLVVSSDASLFEDRSGQGWEI